MRTDTELAAALAEGDSAALADIYDRYADHLHNFCYGVCRNPEQAADATQQTFLLAFERIGQLRDPSRLKSWLFAIARNEVMKGFRDTSRTRPVDDDAVLETATSSDSVEQDFETSELQNLVWEAAAGLDERDRLLLELNVRSGLDGAELAAAIGVDADHGYVLAKRMRERVEKSLGALVVARQARTMCSDLERLLSDWDGNFSIPIRKRVSRHLTQCDECEERRRKLLSPIALYGAAPVLAAPLGLKDTILDAVGSFVQTAEASEYKWDKDGFPEPLESHWLDEEEVDNLNKEHLPSSRKRLRRFGFYAFLVGGVVTLSVVLTAGGGEGPILTPEKLNETESSAISIQEDSEETSASLDTATATPTTVAPVETTTTTVAPVETTTTTVAPVETTTTTVAPVETTTTTTQAPDSGDAPDAPTLVALALWDGLIGIDWREPTYGGTAPITDFVIQFRSGNAGRWITANDGISTETFGLVSDLTNGTEYFFRVAAVNSVGTGAWSNVLSDTPYDFDPYNFDANGNQGTRWLYWNKPNSPDTPGNTLYQLGVLVNGTGNVQTTNKSTSTAGWNTFSESLMVNKDSHESGMINCNDSYDFYIRVINTDFFGTTVVTDWVTSNEWMNYSYSNTLSC